MTYCVLVVFHASDRIIWVNWFQCKLMIEKCFSFRFSWRFIFFLSSIFLLPLKTVWQTFAPHNLKWFLFLFRLFLFFNCYSVPQSYVYGSPYLGAATTASAAGLVPIPATQLSHAAAIAAATNQFYEYQVSLKFKISQFVTLSNEIIW